MSEHQDKITELRIIKLRDQNAFEDFYKSNFDPIKRYLISRTSEPELAIDLTEEAFVELWQMIFVKRNILEARNLRGLLFVIAKRRMFDHFRRNPRGRVLTDEYLENVEAESNFLEELDVQVDIAAVQNVMKEMPDQYQKVITLRYLDELEFDEMAAALQKSTGAIRVLLHRALKELRKRLL